MTGFDVVLLGSFYGLPQFNKRYGVQLPDGTYTIKTGEFSLLLHFGASASGRQLLVLILPVTVHSLAGRTLERRQGR